jgi:2-amino-4-hydroxy-6-hydroxymethyldihydropteridine diphosphokinase
MTKCLIALGSNLGDRAATLDAAIDALAADGVEVTAQSSWQLTLPVGGGNERPQFLNGAALLETSLSPHELLTLLQQVEQQLGRERHERWGDRTIDLDLLLFGDEVIDTQQLTVPHPRMSFRRFVLEPAVEIAAEMVHPTIGWTLAQLLEQLDSGGDFVAIVAKDERTRERLAANLIEKFKLVVCEPAEAEASATYLSLTGDSTPSGSPQLSILHDLPIAEMHGRGPTLRVPVADGQEIEADIFAAIEAVWPRLGPSGG